MLLLVWFLAASDDRQGRPAKARERVGDDVVESTVVAGQVAWADPARGLGGRVEWEVGGQGASKGRWFF